MCGEMMSADAMDYVRLLYTRTLLTSRRISKPDEGFVRQFTMSCMSLPFQTSIPHLLNRPPPIWDNTVEH